MARAMTEFELLEFCELNKRQSEIRASKDEYRESRRLADLMHEIEEHLYRYELKADNADMDATAQL